MHAAAVQYLRARRARGSVDLSIKATQACQDLTNLGLLRVQDNFSSIESR